MGAGGGWRRREEEFDTVGRKKKKKKKKGKRTEFHLTFTPKNHTYPSQEQSFGSTANWALEAAIPPRATNGVTNE
jgi:hypothetical protein